MTFDGFPVGYEVFAGNTHDLQTLDDRGHHGGPARNTGAGVDLWIDCGMAGARDPRLASPHRAALYRRAVSVSRAALAATAEASSAVRAATAEMVACLGEASIAAPAVVQNMGSVAKAQHSSKTL